MADHIYANKFEELTQELSSQNNLFKDIIFCKTSHVSYLFDNIKFINKKFIIITHNDDNCIKERDYTRKPNNVVHWYAANCEYNISDLTPIPYGLQNKYGYNADPNTIVFFEENEKHWNNTHKIIDVVYCNWTNGSNPIRPQILSNLDKNKVMYDWFENYAAKGIFLGRKEYYDTIAKYKFVISPPGNAFDDPTHADCPRTWEILYTGSVPIIIKNNLYKEYEDDFPMIQVNDYSEVTYDLLDDYLSKEHNNTEKLYMSYWKKRITEQYNKL